MSTPFPEYGSEEYTTLLTALQEAATHGDLALLQQAGVVVVDHVDDRSCTLLHRALQARQLHVVAWLVEESERTGLNIAQGWTSLHLASMFGDMDKLRAASNEELGRRSRFNKTVLHVAAMFDQAEVIEYLVRERGLDVERPAVLASTAVNLASEYGSVSAIETLVACGARLRGRKGGPSKALRSAARSGQVAAMEKLVELGADITAVDGWGGVVHDAIRCGREEVLETAVRLGADPRAVSGGGDTALHAAVIRNKLGVLRRLVQLGVPVDAVNKYGQTALWMADSSPQACRALLELGADRWIKDGQGETVRERAERCGKSGRMRQVVELLDTYWPIVPCMAQLLLGLRGPSESPLTRFAAHSAFEPKVLSLVNCLLTGKTDKAFVQLVEEC